VCLNTGATHDHVAVPAHLIGSHDYLGHEHPSVHNEMEGLTIRAAEAHSGCDDELAPVASGASATKTLLRQLSGVPGQDPMSLPTGPGFSISRLNGASPPESLDSTPLRI
jgi:hypothetical protein